VLTRQDFVVTDTDALLAVAREAGARARGESAEDFEVVSVGHALYELIHDGGRAALDECDSLAAMASITLFQTQDAPLDHTGIEAADDSDNGYQALFRADGETLFSFSEVWR
jgi:hypothetical protein